MRIPNFKLLTLLFFSLLQTTTAWVMDCNWNDPTPPSSTNAPPTTEIHAYLTRLKTRPGGLGTVGYGNRAFRLFESEKVSFIVVGEFGAVIKWEKLALAVYAVVAECSSGGYTKGKVENMYWLWPSPGEGVHEVTVMKGHGMPWPET